MNLAKQQSIRKIWIVLQEIKEKLILTQDDDTTINFPKIPRGIYLQKWLEILGENASEDMIINERAEVIKGLNKRYIVDFEEEMDNFVRFTTTEKFDDFCKKIEKKYSILPETNKNKVVIKFPSKTIGKRKNLITRDKITGDFYYKNKPIKFENKETIYYLIFECLYEKGDLEGFCSYETINRYLEKYGKEQYTDNKQIMDRIKNGIINLFRFSNLPSKAPDGKELIQKIRGKGIILYNPPL